MISIDGTTIAANGSHEWLADQARRIAGDVVADADATDAAEDTCNLLLDETRPADEPHHRATPRRGAQSSVRPKMRSALG